MAGRRIVLVPGNHDHRLAEPLLDEVALAGDALGLEHRGLPAGEPATRIAGWLGKAELGIAYPGVWLRDDVYATHGHYMDCHMSLPRLECVAAAAVMRAGGAQPPDPATPADYERVAAADLWPRLRARRDRPGSPAPPCPRSEPGARSRAAIARAAGPARPPRKRPSRPASRAASGSSTASSAPASTPNFSPASISRSGIDAATEMSRRLRDRGRPHDHRPHPPRRPRRERGRVAAARRRAPPQHRQLGLRGRLPPPRLPARSLLAGNRHLGRGRGRAAPRAPAARPAARGAAGRGPPHGSNSPIDGPIRQGGLDVSARRPRRSSGLQPLGDDAADLRPASSWRK